MDVKIKFTSEFSSPVFGNVWIGREVVTSAKMAEKMIAHGHAEKVEVKPFRKEEVAQDSAKNVAIPKKVKNTKKSKK